MHVTNRLSFPQGATEELSKLATRLLSSKTAVTLKSAEKALLPAGGPASSDEGDGRALGLDYALGALPSHLASGGEAGPYYSEDECLHSDDSAFSETSYCIHCLTRS